MGLNDVGKLAVLLSAIGASIVLCLAGKVAGDAALGVVVYVAGYVTGNGVLARRRQAPSTVLAPKLHHPKEPELEEGP